MKKEIELKYLLSSKEDLVRLQGALLPYMKDKPSLLVQENYYFDTSKLTLKKDGISLRLRKENNDFLLCAKQSLRKKRQKSHLSVRLEFEGLVSKEAGELMIEQYLSPLEAYKLLPAVGEALDTRKLLYGHMKKALDLGVQLLGSFINHRTAVPIEILGHKITLELDHSFYPKGIEIFEVEVEFISAEQAELLRPLIEDLFRQVPIKTSKSISKSSRLYRILAAKD